jgi:hypothetical protein
MGLMFSWINGLVFGLEHMPSSQEDDEEDIAWFMIAHVGFFRVMLIKYI